jgi:hypothetical protein
MIARNRSFGFLDAQTASTIVSGEVDVAAGVMNKRMHAIEPLAKVKVFEDEE